MNEPCVVLEAPPPPYTPSFLAWMALGWTPSSPRDALRCRVCVIGGEWATGPFGPTSTFLIRPDLGVSCRLRSG